MRDSARGCGRLLFVRVRIGHINLGHFVVIVVFGRSPNLHCWLGSFGRLCFLHCSHRGLFRYKGVVEAMAVGETMRPGVSMLGAGWSGVGEAGRESARGCDVDGLPMRGVLVRWIGLTGSGEKMRFSTGDRNGEPGRPNPNAPPATLVLASAPPA